MELRHQVIERRGARVQAGVQPEGSLVGEGQFQQIAGAPAVIAIIQLGNHPGQLLVHPLIAPACHRGQIIGLHAFGQRAKHTAAAVFEQGQ